MFYTLTIFVATSFIFNIFLSKKSLTHFSSSLVGHISSLQSFIGGFASNQSKNSFENSLVFGLAFPNLYSMISPVLIQLLDTQKIINRCTFPFVSSL
jgi:hypothetical protein